MDINLDFGQPMRGRDYGPEYTVRPLVLKCPDCEGIVGNIFTHVCIVDEGVLDMSAIEQVGPDDGQGSGDEFPEPEPSGESDG